MKLFCKFLLLFVLILVCLNGFAQRYASRNGTVKLTYQAPHGKMEAINRQVNVGLNVETGELRLNMVMLSFRLHSAYSQQKYNDYFITNAHFANSTFKGKIENLNQIDFSKKGEYEAKVKGSLTLRQTTAEIATKGKFIVSENNFSGKSVFKVNLMDFNFNIPPTMEKFIEVTFEVNLQKL